MQEVDQAGMPVGEGAAWVLRWKNQWLGTNELSLGDKAEVYDAEALAACGELEAALTSPMITVAQGIHICLDNLSVAQAVGTNTEGSSQAAFLRFRVEKLGSLVKRSRHNCFADYRILSNDQDVIASLIVGSCRAVKT